MKILYCGTHGSDDPTRAGFPFIFTKGAIEAGHEPVIFLAGEATYLLKEEVAAATQGVGWPAQGELWKDMVKHKVPIHVWGVCGRTRGVTEADLARVNGRWSTPKAFAELAASVDRVLTF